MAGVYQRIAEAVLTRRLVAEPPRDLIDYQIRQMMLDLQVAGPTLVTTPPPPAPPLLPRLNCPPGAPLCPDDGARCRRCKTVIYKRRYNARHPRRQSGEYAPRPKLRVEWIDWRAA